MAEAPLFTANGEPAGVVSLRDDVFGVDPNPALIHQAVQRQLANARQGTHDTKTRGEVAGSTKKMWRQKGTGRARQGSKRAPHWRTGGVVFGPHPRSYRQDMPKKMRSGALRSALSVRVKAGELVVVQSLPHLEAPSTKIVRTVIDAVASAKSRLVVMAGPDDTFRLSARNLPGVRVITTESMNTYDVMRHGRVVVTLDAARQIEDRLGLPDGAGEDHDDASE
jgi:large subunit ribosomal protein L4